ncbi:MAG TPA: PIN domain-containing protein [Rhizomicrobium sp.]|jgi:predicted nucleic acid-binding protein|nr:PIN domain-containing protein [Rhizomicrobium sp.]
MIAVDSSTLIAFIQGDRGSDVQLLDQSIVTNELALPAIVLTEVLSDPQLPESHSTLIRVLPTLDIGDGYWARAAETRAKLLARRLRARLADTLIAQSCIDNDVALITRDADFRHFAKYCGLRLA